MERKVHPKITVVTPNYNQDCFIEHTILSVLNQKYPNLEYIIIDGGSTDASVSIIKKYEDKLHYWVSENDSGMYDAINKGFSMSSGEIMCWINSDDILMENSLHLVSKIFINNSRIKWVQGLPTVINEEGDIVFQRQQVFSKLHFYLLNHENNFSFIQQESTFWSRELWKEAGGKLNEQFKLAADFDLWMRFFNIEKMYCTDFPLGAFRVRIGQKSGDKETYLKETKQSLNSNYKILKKRDQVLITFLLFLAKSKNVINKTKFNKAYYKIQSLIIGRPNRIDLSTKKNR
tara:strand:+ start:9618 stop:10484 length:867 start_codon:yes stop_codon:yes gene_type:complete